MYGKVANVIKEVFSDSVYIPYVRKAENVPHSADSFVSLYLISSEIEYPNKSKTTYQVLYAKRIKDFSEETLEVFEKEVYQKVKEILRELPCVQSGIDFGLSDAYIYAYIRFTLRENV